MAESPAATLITAYEVRPDADAAFSTGWELARRFVGERGALRSTTLHRALRGDVLLRFVEIALIESAARWRDAVADPAFPGAGSPFTAHPGVYEAIREEGDPDGAGGVVLITPFEAPAGEDERFLGGWSAMRERFAARQGYLGARVHRSLDQADFRFVTVVRWSSPLMLSRSLQQPEVEQAIAAMPFAGRPALYLRTEPGA